jgi:urease accessory protein UreE
MKEELKRVLEKAQKEGKSVGVFLKSPPGFYSGKVLKVTDEGFVLEGCFPISFQQVKAYVVEGEFYKEGE